LLLVAAEAVKLALEIMVAAAQVVSAQVKVWQSFQERHTQLQLVLVVRSVQMAQIPQ
jgi:hypothetical protein